MLPHPDFLSSVFPATLRPSHHFWPYPCFPDYYVTSLSQITPSCSCKRRRHIFLSTQTIIVSILTNPQKSSHQIICQLLLRPPRVLPCGLLSRSTGLPGPCSGLNAAVSSLRSHWWLSWAWLTADWSQGGGILQTPLGLFLRHRKSISWIPAPHPPPMV